MIKLGLLVRSRSVSAEKSPNNDLGIGKVTELSYSTATVEYFCSIGQRLEKTLPLTSLYRVQLPPQTRCYIQPETQDTWIIGRIFDWDQDKGQYRIDLPDKKIALVAEHEIYVRCNLPIDDPIETLAMKGQETPYFHDRRLAFVQCLIEQRAVSRGMTGLISANIDLYPHQVEVVRRVLEDPIQRYLLADEVGLGKTIEAGAILRQYLLDEPQGRAVVLVPQYLREQWLQELEHKFYVSDLDNRVQVLAVEDVDRVSPNADLGFLILDEAHHIAAMATSSDSIKRSRFQTCKHLAHKSDRLLLLSATPVLNHEQDFLAMLHLLDPSTYQLDDLEGFRARVKNRQQIGRVLLSFKEKANPFVLKTNLNQLRNLFSEDKYLLNLVEELQNCLLSKETLPADRDRIVRSIRTHISDTYRLHRRMLRNRRAAVEDVIFARNVTPKVEYDLDERSPQLHELIDEWRTVAPNQQQYQQIFLLLFRASGTWLGILAQVLETRLSGISHSALIQEFGADNIRILTETPKFSGEEQILQSLLRIIQQPSEEGSRLELLKIVILYHLSETFKLQSYRSNLHKLLEQVQQQIRRPISGTPLPKIVIFTSFAQTGAEIFRCLSDTFGQASVASHQLGLSRSHVEKSLNKFKNDRNCFILVCDSSAEEGRNFQFVDWMIHFDLPWSPNRLEQRIGRIDRIGRPLNVQFTVFAGSDLEDSPHDAWYQLLKDGFGIFHQSIASLQFYVDEKLPGLLTTMFQSGASGLLEMIETIQQEIAEEKVKISEQNALDEIDAQDENATQYFQILDDYDARHQEIKRATEDWICQALHFKQIDDPNLEKVGRYQPTKRTLIPIHDLQTRFAAYAQPSGTYNRRISTKYPGVNLYRIGEEFVEALASYIHWDDRGQAFALWRCDRSWDAGEGMEWFGFRFNYVVEADLELAQQVSTDFELERSRFVSVKRRADALFPPILETIFIDARYEPMSIVEDEAVLKILQGSYKGKSSHPCRDYNLAKSRLSVLNEFVDESKWPDLCSQARETSEILLRDRTFFISLCEQRARIADQKLGNRVDQLRLRLNRMAESQQTSHSLLAKEVNIETALSQAILEGIRHPRIKLDSVGFIVVSGRPPVESQEGGDE
ncbi:MULTISPECIES: protein DpdE [unclassified Microcoleus]|uniref:protein DpdE n=1 Tax=unclassified Microcoleus TaxID=2642155 RepID=UPI002FD095B0